MVRREVQELAADFNTYVDDYKVVDSLTWDAWTAAHRV